MVYVSPHAAWFVEFSLLWKEEILSVVADIKNIARVPKKFYITSHFILELSLISQCQWAENPYTYITL